MRSEPTLERIGEADAARGTDGGRIVVVHVMTAPESLTFLRGQASFLRASGYDIHVVASPGPELAEFAEREGVTAHAVEMTRQMSPLRDARALWNLWRLLRRIRPVVVHAHFPKSGLLGMTAAWLARTPLRVYHLRGLRHATASGFLRVLLFWTDRTSCRLAHRVLCVSRSNMSIAIDERLCPAHKMKVLAGGSSNGVDAMVRFKPAAEPARATARDELGIPRDALAIGFVGRLVRDKGIVELAKAWRPLRERHPHLHLILVGPLERERREDTLPPEIVRPLEADPRVHLTGFVRDISRLYPAMDIVALPTYREGLPNVALEAAAMALPIVATAVPGCVDAIQDGVTGTLVPPRDEGALAEALHRYVDDRGLRARHGEAARRRVLAEFRREAIWDAVAAEYRSLLSWRRGAAERSSQ